MSPFSDLARAYGQMWDVLRVDTERVLVDMFGADRALVEVGADEWFEMHPEYVDTPPAHLERRPDVAAEADHASRAADLILALVVARDPSCTVSPALHDAMTALVHAVAAAVARR